MESVEATTNGYVYILEVKDIQLPVCKIGMTKRSPSKRCAEINKSSTGDFIWAVSNYFSVDDCKKLESLVHSKLAPLRQKGREFFSLNPDDANKAIISIIDAQNEISKVEENAIKADAEIGATPAFAQKRKIYKDIDSKYAALLQLFASIQNVKGRPFGQLNRPTFGMSDGKQGVQWNLAVTPETGKIKLGVNLEGSEKTGKWLISSFIFSEPDIEDLRACNYKNDIYVRFSRDAWQGSARLDIAEKYLGGREYSLAELDSTRWNAILKEALTCLDENRDYRKRKTNQTVTLVSDGRIVTKEISPHLTIWTEVSMEGDVEENMKEKTIQMTPIYDWVVSSCNISKN